VKEHDKQLARTIKALRADTEAIVRGLIDAHMAKHYPDVTPFWAHAQRASIEVATWPAWKQRRCYAQKVIEL
jgi:hypothetical protein